MHESQRTIIQGRIIIIILVVLIVGCYINLPIVMGKSQPTVSSTPETPTITLTSTPTLPNTSFEAVVKESAACFAGTSQAYEKLVDIPQFKVVMVLGKNSESTWFQVRWHGDTSTKDCWVDSNLLAPSNFVPDMLPILSTPPAPTFTPTPTKAVVIVPATRTRKSSDHSSSSAQQTAQAAAQQTAQAAAQQTAQAAAQQTAQAAAQQTAQAAAQQTAQALTNQAPTPCPTNPSGKPKCN